MQYQIIFSKSKYTTGFDKVVSSGMFSSYFFQVIFPLGAIGWVRLSIHFNSEKKHTFIFHFQLPFLFLDLRLYASQYFSLPVQTFFIVFMPMGTALLRPFCLLSIAITLFVHEDYIFYSSAKVFNKIRTLYLLLPIFNLVEHICDK